MSTPRKGSKKDQVQAQDIEEYEVESITGTKKVGKKTYYRIHWKGFDASEDTWEPEENLHCPQLLKKFKEAQETPAEVQDQVTEAPDPTITKIVSFKMVAHVEENKVRKAFLVQTDEQDSPYWLPESKIPDKHMLYMFLNDVIKKFKEDPKGTIEALAPVHPTTKKGKEDKLNQLFELVRLTHVHIQLEGEVLSVKKDSNGEIVYTFECAGPHITFDVTPEQPIRKKCIRKAILKFYEDKAKEQLEQK